jgi:hypothetical protein
MSCTDKIIERISDPATFSSWQAQTTTALAAVTSTTNDAALTLLETDVTNTINCLQTKTRDTRSANSDITGLYQEYSALQNQYQSQQAALSISKDRAALLTHPEQKTTVYESWFPLHRPLQTSSLLVLIVTSLFFFSVFVGLLARQMGFHLDLAYIPFPGGILKTAGMVLGGAIAIGLIAYVATTKIWVKK